MKAKSVAVVIVAVGEAVAAILGAFKLKDIRQEQAQVQNLRVNIVNSIEGKNISISETSGLEDVIDELLSVYSAESEKNKEMEKKNQEGADERARLQEEINKLEEKEKKQETEINELRTSNTELHTQVDNLEGFILEKYSSDDVAKLIQGGYIKEKADKRLDELVQLDGIGCEQVSSVKDLYGTTHSTSYQMKGDAWVKFKLDGAYDTFSANVVTSEETGRSANIRLELYVDNVLTSYVNDITRSEDTIPISANVNNGNVLMIKTIVVEGYDACCYICDAKLSELE